MILIKNIELYTPRYSGKKDILIGGKKILSIKDNISITLEPLEIIEGSNLIATPGFIDSHVHITGGGGEGGFHTRTPELTISDMISAGVTTVVGCLGTDGVSRTMESLVAKAKGLKEEGVSAFVYTGSYKLPLSTLTENVRKDIMFVEEIIGAGEIALSDHRSSQPSINELKKLISDVRRAGILSNKAGIINIHLGDGKRQLNLIKEIVQTTEIPITQFIPTHINRNNSLFEAGLTYAKMGGFIDFTTSTTKQFINNGEVEASLALKKALEAGVSENNITLTSDGQGSLPAFNENGDCIGLDIGKCYSLYTALKNAVQEHKITLETALKAVTENPARILKLKDKGTLKPKNDADLVLLDKTLKIRHVIANGHLMLKNGEIIHKGTFE